MGLGARLGLPSPAPAIVERRVLRGDDDPAPVRFVPGGDADLMGASAIGGWAEAVCAGTWGCKYTKKKEVGK